jgi:DNA-binding HxlR family transcriptional regulator
MADQEVAPRACSIASALEVVGEKWSLLVLREVFHGNRRFGDIQRMTGAPKDVLTRRLVTLVASGVLEKREYSSRPPRFEYQPTEAAMELRPVLLFLDQWGTKWLPDAVHSDTILRHDCGEILTVHAVCDACDRPVTGTDVTSVDPVAA